jgi:hypothetical protein
MLDDPTSQLLAIIVLPAAIGLCWLFAALLMQRPIRDMDEARHKHFGKSFTVLSISDAFDAERIVIWQSQLPALQLIGPGISRSELWNFFEHASALYPELYEGIAFEEWLRFLETCDLVARVRGEVRLTPNGRDFLDYLQHAAKASGSRDPARRFQQLPSG